jgi:serine/threonine protein phosphatase PrpC
MDSNGDLCLDIIEGPLMGEQAFIRNDMPATVGRASDNTISVPDRELSRRHSKIEFDPDIGAFVVSDLGSTNGTYVQLVGPYGGRHRLNLNDHILVGRTGFSINRFDFGVSEEMGHRQTMEDACTIVQHLNMGPLCVRDLSPQSFFGVFDGHGGVEASYYLSQNLHINVAEGLLAVADELLLSLEEAGKLMVDGDHGHHAADGNGNGSGYNGGNRGGGEAKGGPPSSSSSSSSSSLSPNSSSGPDVWQSAEMTSKIDKIVIDSLKQSFRKTDDEFIRKSEYPQHGSTATTALILGRRLYCANVGDSRTLLCRNFKPIAMSHDHKPSREDEAQRIRDAGGFVINNRVMGELAVSRAFGDSEFKKGVQVSFVNNVIRFGCRLNSLFSSSPPLALPPLDNKYSVHRMMTASNLTTRARVLTTAIKIEIRKGSREGMVYRM